MSSPGRRQGCDAPTANAWTGRDLPFTMNGGSASVANGLRASSSTPCRREDLRRRRGRHQAGREIHRVAHHRVRAAVGGPISPAKTWPRLTPMRSGSARSPLDDAAQGAQHPLLVLAGGARHARGEDDLAAVLVDVGTEERDAVLLGRDRAASSTSSSSASASAAGRRLGERVDPVEVHERDRCDAVLRIVATGEQEARGAVGARREIEPRVGAMGCTDARRASVRARAATTRPDPSASPSAAGSISAPRSRG